MRVSVSFWKCLLVLSLCMFGVTRAADLTRLCRQANLSGGLIVYLDCADAACLTPSGPTFTVQALSRDRTVVATLRRSIAKTGKYGQISVITYNGKELPYIDNLVNLLVCDQAPTVSADEVMRVLAPGGRFVCGSRVHTKEKPAGFDEWNQCLHSADNNGVSLDDVGPIQRLRWHDEPEFGRSKALTPSVTNMVSAGGIVLTVEDRATTEDVNAATDYRLVARDAYNGIRLWERKTTKWDQWLGGSIKYIAIQQQRCLAAIGDSVYFCPEFAGPIVVLDIRTGVEKTVLNQTRMTAEFVIDDDMLYGIRGGVPFTGGIRGKAVAGVALFALDLRTKKIRWEKKISGTYFGGSLAAKGGYLVYWADDLLYCLKSGDGATLWNQSMELTRTTGKKKAKTTKRKRPAKTATTGGLIKDYATLFTPNDYPAVVLAKGRVCIAAANQVVAMDLQNGKTVWTAKVPPDYQKGNELFVVHGQVWGLGLVGYDLKTGKVVRKLNQQVTGPMAHDRCYRNRITHRYYLNSASGGTDFMKLDGTAERPNPWARSTCGLAVMPANNMIYNCPYVCQCAIGAMATGFNALYNGTGNSDKPFKSTLTPRLEKGPAWGYTGGPEATSADWPTYRHSTSRNGASGIDSPRNVATKWSVRIGPHPTAPVAVGDLVYVASRDAHTIYALDRDTGRTRWSFIVDARIDSPPTYYKGVLAFGSRGGWVYCLRAADGKLIWRFMGMPERRLICDKGRPESAWPVNGSVTLFQGRFYFAAGRNSFLDGGIALFALDPFTGAVKHSNLVHGPFKEGTTNFPIPSPGTFQMKGFRSGILSCSNNRLFIRHQPFAPDLKTVELDAIKTPHIIASPGFLDDSPQHRTYWTIDVDIRYGGPTGQWSPGPGGDIISFDGRTFVEVRGYPPGRNMAGRGRGMDPRKIYCVYSGKRVANNVRGAWKANARTIPAFGAWAKRWQTPTPFAGHALAVSKSAVFVAGVPMPSNFSKADTTASFLGKKGGVAWILDPTSGQKLQEIRLDAAPTWDGIAVTRDAYFVSLKDGRVTCLAGQ